MANIIDKFMDMMQLGYDEFDGEDMEPEEEYEEKSGGLFKKSSKNDSDKEVKSKASKKEVKKSKEIASKTEKQSVGFGNKVSVVKGGKDLNMSSEIVSIRPVDDSAKKEIGSQLLNGKNVLINLEGLDSDIAQRVVDFTAGVCYAINGDMKYPSKYFVLAVPNQVELTGFYEGEDHSNTETTFNGMSFDRFR